jgi:hypothetical protein
MSYEERVDMITMVAGYDASEVIFRFVVTGSDGKAELAGAGVVPSGVVTVGAPENHGIRVAVKGITPVEASGALTAGNSVATAAEGKAVLAGSAIVVGIVQATADGNKTVYGAGDFVPVLLV